MLETVWFLLWGLLWAVYFMLDGFDLGLGTLFPFVTRNDTERRIVYNSMGPFWDGNEVWLITAGGVTFAAFPTTYAAMFSGLYSALMLVLFALILRGVSFTVNAGQVVAIVGRSGAGKTTLINLIPRYLPRFGMAPRWVAYRRPMVFVLLVADMLVTMAFHANVEAQGGAYATGVLVLILSAAIAVLVLGAAAATAQPSSESAPPPP